MCVCVSVCLCVSVHVCVSVSVLFECNTCVFVCQEEGAHVLCTACRYAVIVNVFNSES